MNFVADICYSYLGWSKFERETQC